MAKEATTYPACQAHSGQLTLTEHTQLWTNNFKKFK